MWDKLGSLRIDRVQRSALSRTARRTANLEWESDAHLNVKVEHSWIKKRQGEFNSLSLSKQENFGKYEAHEVDSRSWQQAVLQQLPKYGNKINKDGGEILAEIDSRQTIRKLKTTTCCK